MDFEKAYKDALERARKKIKHDNDHVLYESDIEEIFPELKESEDERIRKVIRLALIASEDDLSAFYKTHDITRKECTDWLEKQKIVPVQTEKERNYIRTLQGLISDFLRDNDGQANQEFYQECWDWLEGRHVEQKELKSAEWNDSVAKEMFIKALERAVEQTKKGYELTDCDKHSWWEDFKVYSEIKSAEWSKEDIEVLETTIAVIEKNIKKGSQITTKATPSGYINREDLIKRLKSLRPQPYWKPSSHELGALRTAISILTEERNFPRAGKHLQDILDHFEGKETRHDWKPSEEQMEALYAIIPKSGMPATLQSLYNDLKKLK